MKKYYAVKNGRNIGIFLSWEECEKQVKGFKGANYKGFKTIEEAKKYLKEKNIKGSISNSVSLNKLSKNKPSLNASQHEKKTYALYEDNTLNDFGEVYAFIDGSFNDKTKMYGYGGFLVSHDKEYILKGSFTDKEGVMMRNVAGEIEGSMAAVRKAKELNETKLIIYYDYKGIENWATGEWKRNKKKTKEYYDFMKNAMINMDISFRKVKAHSKMKENDRADKLAKESVGI